jgi:hypothetical protein
MEMSEGSVLIHRLLEKKKEIVIGSVSVIAGVAILIAYFQSGPTALSYAKAEAAFSQWQDSPLEDELYLTMKSTIEDVPALEKKYEAAIAQKLMSTEKIDQALLMANRSIERVKHDAPFHSAYGQTSLLIEQGSFQQALENAVALKEKMSGSDMSGSKPGSLLYAHNLLRIACLQQELNNRPGEKVAWEELESFLQANSSASELLMSSFSVKQVTLSQYIDSRKKTL